jgi:hypothetical protein
VETQQPSKINKDQSILGGDPSCKYVDRSIGGGTVFLDQIRRNLECPKEVCLPFITVGARDTALDELVKYISIHPNKVRFQCEADGNRMLLSKKLTNNKGDYCKKYTHDHKQ